MRLSAPASSLFNVFHHEESATYMWGDRHLLLAHIGADQFVGWNRIWNQCFGQPNTGSTWGDCRHHDCNKFKRGSSGGIVNSHCWNKESLSYSNFQEDQHVSLPSYPWH